MENIIDININPDGVYLTIVQVLGAPRVSRIDVLSKIEAFGVSDIDYVAINEALKSNNERIEVKISQNTNIVQIEESASVEINRNRMEAYITFSGPVNSDRLLTMDEIMALIEGAGIRLADRDEVAAQLAEKRYGQKYTIAKGIPPINGTDGFLQYHFDNSNLRPKPKIMDDGSVNFRQLGIFRLCNRGDMLVTSVAPKEGVNGTDVCGNTIPYTKGRLPMPIPRGKNTVLSEDGLHLIADVSGQLVIADSKINISPTLEIMGNVDNSTGDIDFNGMVTVRGNVVSGFTVKATGNIEVHGVCEGATLISDSCIVLGNGAQGSDKAELKAGGDITAKFIESCKVTADGNIMADSVLKSVVRCGGSVTLSGKNGLLVGGSVIAGKTLTAKTIGSPMGTLTEVEVGANPEEITKHRNLTGEYEKIKKEFAKCDMAVTTLSSLKQKGQLTEEKKSMLLKMINTKQMMRDKMNKIQIEIDDLVQQLAVNKGTVSASKAIRPGVRVTIGNAQLSVRDEIQNCTLRNNGAKIAIGPCV